jgi:hypothetical protein
MKVLLRALTMVALSIAAICGLSGTASADVPPYMPSSFYGEDIWTLGDHAFCRGSVHIGFSTDHSKPGITTAVLEPRGMIGDGPDWTNNPSCGFNVTFGFYNGNFPFYQYRTVTLHVGQAPQAPTFFDLDTGVGLNQIGAWTQYANKGVGFYVINVP